MNDTTLSPQRLEEIKARRKAVISDHWFYDARYAVKGYRGDMMEDIASGVYSPEEAEFIAHSLDDIDVLIAEIERRQGGVE